MTTYDTAKTPVLDTLQLALTALNTAPRFRVQDTDSYAIASKIEAVLGTQRTVQLDGLHRQTPEAPIDAFANRLHHGDCLSVMQSLPAASINLIVTDPPYLVRYKSRDGRSYPNDDNSKWVRPAFAEMYRVLKPNSFCVSFYGWSRAEVFLEAWKAAGFRRVGHIMFPKRYTSKTKHLRYQHECAYLLAKGTPAAPANPIGDVIHWKYAGNVLHPAQKPVAVLEPLIKTFSNPGDLVLDPFAGSASTCVAARTLGRRYIGIELCQAYYDIASKRLAQDPAISPAA